MAPSRTIGNVDEDPLWIAIQPPPDETPERRARRLKDEAQAKKVSDQIDEIIKAESAMLKKQKIVRLLLLGQSESGKSTTLKQFQLLHSPNAFASERLSWRVVIQLNLVRNIQRILEAVLTLPSPATPTASTADDERWDTSASGVAYPRMSMDSFASTLSSATGDGFHELKYRLLPLLRAEAILVDKLSSPDTDDFQGKALGGREGFTQASWTERQSNNTEMFVRSGNAWKEKNKATLDAQVTDDEVTRIIHSCRDDMISLWRHPQVHEALKVKKLNLSECSGFFMNDMERITTKDYVPTNSDILNARLKTVGVIEHRFELNTASEKGVDWRIYDVGGARSQRAAWAPFFDNVQAIIFLAPVSVFDQVLVEDPSVNRLEDSLILWKELCKNTVLCKVPLVLFLNKCDLLRRKLHSGARLKDHMVSYADRPNDYESISRYFKSKFDAIRRQYSTRPERPFYAYLTSVTDTHQTAAIITSVRDMILRDNLRTSHLI